jgi:hypothetical protein
MVPIGSFTGFVRRTLFYQPSLMRTDCGGHKKIHALEAGRGVQFSPAVTFGRADMK